MDESHSDDDYIIDDFAVFKALQADNHERDPYGMSKNQKNGVFVTRALRASGEAESYCRGFHSPS